MHRELRPVVFVIDVRAFGVWYWPIGHLLVERRYRLLRIACSMPRGEDDKALKTLGGG